MSTQGTIKRYTLIIQKVSGHLNLTLKKFNLLLKTKDFQYHLEPYSATLNKFGTSSELILFTIEVKTPMRLAKTQQLKQVIH
jgi:hypothetical protein